MINLGCEKCEYTTDRLDCLKRHIVSKHYQNEIKCPECSVQFSRKDNLVRHKLEYHSKNPLTPMNRIQDDAGTAFPLTLTPTTLPTQAPVLEHVAPHITGKSYDIRLKENLKLFISGPSRCGKTFLFLIF